MNDIEDIDNLIKEKTSSKLSECEECENISSFECNNCSRNPKLEDKFKKAKAFKINDYLSLVFTNGLALVLVNGEEFKQCKQLKLEFPTDNSNLEEMASMESIDEIADFVDNKRRSFQYNYNEVNLEYTHITPEEAFWGHCSNLDAWYKEGYNTNILHRSLSFPLLKELYKAGDPQAKIAFKEEIAQTLNSNYFPRFLFLLEGDYLEYLSSEEINSIAEEIKNPIKRIYIKNYLKKEYLFSYFHPTEGLERLYFSKKGIAETNSIYSYKDGIRKIERKAKIEDFKIFRFNDNWQELEKYEEFNLYYNITEGFTKIFSFNGSLMNLILDKSYIESAISFLENSLDITLLLPKRVIKGTSYFKKKTKCYIFSKKQNIFIELIPTYLIGKKLEKIREKYSKLYLRLNRLRKRNQLKELKITVTIPNEKRDDGLFVDTMSNRYDK